METKKKWSLRVFGGMLITLLVVFAVGMHAASAETMTVTADGFTYLIVDGNASISKYTGTASSVTVPTSLEYGGTNYRIRKIENFAFENCSSINTLVIPNGISSLGYGAFKNCTGLSSITIQGDIGACSSYNTYNGKSYINGDWRSPEYAYTAPFYNVGANASELVVTFSGSATNVPAYLFATGSVESNGVYAHVTKVILGDSVTTVSGYAFYQCYDLKSVEMGGNLTNINAYAFANDVRLSDLTWGSSLREIADHAFYNCSAISSLSLPGKVTTLGNFSFEKCSHITSLVLPASVSRIDYGVFKNCTGISTITINGNIGNCSNYNTYNGKSYINGDWRSPEYAYTAPFYNVGANASEVKVVFSNGVTRIPSYIFASGASESDGVFSHITSVEIPSSVTSIGSYAFYDCRELTKVTMGSGVNDIEAYAFAYCTRLNDISWSEALREIKNHAFYQCVKLTSINLPSNVTTIANFAFESCSELKKVTLPASMTSLGYGAFRDCTGLQELVIKGNVGGCSKYNTYNGKTYIDGDWKSPEYAYTSPFYKAGMNSDSFTVTFGSSVTAIPSYLFATGGAQSDNTYCAVTKVIIPSSVTSIGTSAFANCYKLSHIEYGSTQTNWEAITKDDGNDVLTSAQILYGTDTEEKTDETGEKTDESGEKTDETGEKTDETDKKDETEKQESTAVTVEGVQYEIPTNNKNEVSVSEIKEKSATSITIPDTVTVDGVKYKITEISGSAFKGMTSLQSVKIGKYVTVIGKKAFYGCSNLKKVSGGAAVTTIMDSAFASCTKLKTLPAFSKLKTLGSKAFSGCTSLTKVNIGSKVTKIGSKAFYGCSKLKSITINTMKLKASSIGSNAFKGIYSKATFNITWTKLSAYKKILLKKGGTSKMKYKEF